MIPTFLSELVRTVLIMSISGGVIVLLLLLLKPFVRHRLPKSTQYLFWIVALLVMLLPLPILLDSVPSVAPVSTVVERTVVSYAEEVARTQPPMPTVIYYTRLDEGNNIVFESTTMETMTTPSLSPGPSISATLSTIFMLLYPVAVVLVLLYNIISYAIFARKLRRDSMQPSSATLDALNHLTKGKRTPKLIISPYAQTPMLTGLFNPTIVLPHSLALQGDDDEQLKSILLHELTHMRRFDIAFKWLSLFACAIHWFNPLVWMLRRELDRICELSCDEAVISDMDTMARQSYGETLIAVASSEKVPLPILRTTMCSEKRALKERLSAIMRLKRRTKLAIVVSVVIVFTIMFMAGTLGAGGRPDVSTSANEVQSEIERIADSYIEEMIATLGVFEEDTATVRAANIIDTHINSFLPLYEFDNILNYPVEMWRLDFIVQTDDIEDGNIRWGTFAPDANGWVGKHMGWHDADVIMIFEMTPLGAVFLGTLDRWEAYEVVDEASAESALRNFLTDRELLAIAPIPHVGVAHETHRIVNALPLPDGAWFLNSIQIGADHGGFGYGAYTLTVLYDIMDIPSHMPGASFEANAARLFGLIENLEAVTFSVNSLVVSHTAEYHYRWSITRQSSASGGGAITSFNGSFRPFSAVPVSNEVVLTIRSVEGFLHEYDISWNGADWRAMPIVFEPNATLRDFRWLDIYPTSIQPLTYYIQDTLHWVEVVRPDEYVGVAWLDEGLPPRRGISFMDERGDIYHLALMGGDAAFQLIEFDVADEGWQSAPSIVDAHAPIPSRVLDIIDAIELGMMRTKAEGIFAPYVTGQRMARVYVSGYAYRYDLISNRDYVYECPFGADTVDLTGLQEGRVRLIVFVNVTDQDIVESFTIHYSIWDGSVYQVRIHPNEDPTPFRVLDGGGWNHDDSVLWG